MARKKEFGDFNAKGIRSSFSAPRQAPGPSGADRPSDLNRAMPLKRRLKPYTGTKNYSLMSEYNYVSLWSRWRRGYELSMYGQQAYDSLSYSFKYYLLGTPGVGLFLPGIAFMYPSTRPDMRMWMVGIRPRGSFNFIDFGYRIDSVTDYDINTYAVKLSERFGAPVSFFKGEVLSNSVTATGVSKPYGYNNYTVVAVGIDNVPVDDPGYAPIYNTLFLSHTADKSWSVVDATTLSVPASGPPSPGEFFVTEMRSQCTCPDFLNRESLNLYDVSLRMRYPRTTPFSLSPGTYDAGPNADTPRDLQTPDDLGWSRSFGFIYLNEIYNIPSYSTESYSDPNLFYFQPKWCKHIYAAMWDLKLRFGRGSETDYWLPQPNDEPLDPYYREHFESQLKKQTSFLRREKDLRWWQKYSPAKDAMPDRMMEPDMYNVMTKTLNAGEIGSNTTLEAQAFEMYTPDEFNPFDPVGTNLNSYDGGTYQNGVLTSAVAFVTLDGGTYQNGVLTSAPTFPINGGTY